MITLSNSMQHNDSILTIRTASSIMFKTIEQISVKSFSRFGQSGPGIGTEQDILFRAHSKTPTKLFTGKISV